MPPAIPIMISLSRACPNRSYSPWFAKPWAKTRPAQIDTSEPQGQRITRKPISHDRSQSPPEFLGKVIRGGLHAASLDAEVRKSLWIRVLHYHHCALADRRRRDPASCSAAEATKEHCGRADCIQGKFHRRVIILPGSFLALLDSGFFPYVNDSFAGIDRPIATGSTRTDIGGRSARAIQV